MSRLIGGEQVVDRDAVYGHPRQIYVADPSTQEVHIVDRGAGKVDVIEGRTREIDIIECRSGQIGICRFQPLSGSFQLDRLSRSHDFHSHKKIARWRDSFHHRAFLREEKSKALLPPAAASIAATAAVAAPASGSEATSAPPREALHDRLPEGAGARSRTIGGLIRTGCCCCCGALGRNCCRSSCCGRCCVDACCALRKRTAA